MDQEIWKDIKGYEGHYMVSNLGRVLSLKYSANQIKKPTVTQYGYCIVNLSKGGKNKNKFVHRLVAEAFIENPQNKRVVNHIDSNRQNNVSDNLEWATHAENTAHGLLYGKMDYSWETAEGTGHPRSKFNEHQIQEVVRRVEEGEPIESVASDMNVTSSTIKAISIGATNTIVTNLKLRHLITAKHIGNGTWIGGKRYNQSEIKQYTLENWGEKYLIAREEEWRKRKHEKDN